MFFQNAFMIQRESDLVVWVIVMRYTAELNFSSWTFLCCKIYRSHKNCVNREKNSSDNPVACSVKPKGQKYRHGDYVETQVKYELVFFKLKF